MSRKRFCRYVGVVGIMVLCLTFIPITSARADTFRLVIGSGHPAVAHWVARAKDYFAAEVKKRVEASTKHKIVWVEAYGGTIAKVGGVLEAVEKGTLNVGVVVVPFEPTKLPVHNVGYYIYFSTSDVDKAARVGEKLYDQVPWLKEVFAEKYNQVYLGSYVNASYGLCTNFPIKTIEDLKGRKIIGAGPNLFLLKHVGAVPVQGVLNETYTSFQTGLIEGVLIFLDPVVSFRFYEVAKYYTNTDFGAIPGSSVLTVNKKTFASLPKEIQDIMVEVGKGYIWDSAKTGKVINQQAVETCEKKGMTFNQLPFEERVRWAKMMPNIAQERAKEADANGMPGSKVYKLYIDLLEKEGYKFPRKWEIK